MNITITGHRPDTFLQSHISEYLAKKKISDVLGGLKRQYGKDLSFNIGGAIGVDQWAGTACVEQDINFKLYLPFIPKVQSKYWKKEDVEALNLLIENANSLTIVDPSGNYNVYRYEERNRLMVDNSTFVVAFWLGKKKGGTFNCIKYALNKSKFVAHGFDNLRLLFNEDLKSGWTPNLEELNDK